MPDVYKRQAHAVLRDHGSCQFGRLLDVVGRSRRDGAELGFFCRPSAGQGRDLVFDLFLAHQIMIALIDLHGIPKGA